MTEIPDEWEVLYTGASFEKDVIPATKIGIRAVWHHRRCEPGANLALPAGCRQVASGVLFGHHSLATQFEEALLRIEENDQEEAACQAL